MGIFSRKDKNIGNNSDPKTNTPNDASRANREFSYNVSPKMADVQRRTATDFMREFQEIENDPRRKFNASHAKISQFISALANRSNANRTSQNHRQNTMGSFTNRDFSISPPRSDRTSIAVQESLRRYGNLCKEGIINKNTVKSLFLSYLVEKQATGITLSEGEQKKLREMNVPEGKIEPTDKVEISEEYFKSQNLLRALGVLDKPFEKTGDYGSYYAGAKLGLNGESRSEDKFLESLTRFAKGEATESDRYPVANSVLTCYLGDRSSIRDVAYHAMAKNGTPSSEVAAANRRFEMDKAQSYDQDGPTK